MDGVIVDRLRESDRVSRPFKPPTPAVAAERAQLQRKRKKVSYKEQHKESDSDSDDGRRKRKKKDDYLYSTEDDLLALVKKYPIFKPKPFDQLTTRRFSFPSMTNKDGNIVTPVLSNMSLGIRPQPRIIPRPLHDPMEDHAIVLYDPTIDDRETDEERKEREKEEQKDRAAQEARDKTVGMYNPHKSLRKLLGETNKKQTTEKVPVVIDPRLGKVLRPHQVEGVKVCDVGSESMGQLIKFLSSCISALLVWLKQANMDV